jgi:hypothetical protein
MAVPKERGSWTPPFFLLIRLFEGAGVGANMLIMDPRGAGRVRARARGGGHAPVVAVLLACANKKAAARSSPSTSIQSSFT